MCDAYDVLEASCNSANVIVSTVYDYGGNSLGEGIRKLAGEMINVGYEQGITDMEPLAYNEGFFEGLHQGYVTGNLNGFIKGSLVTVGAISAIGLVSWGVNKFVKKQNAKKVETKKTDNIETMEVNSYE